MYHKKHNQIIQDALAGSKTEKPENHWYDFILSAWVKSQSVCFSYSKTLKGKLENIKDWYEEIRYKIEKWYHEYDWWTLGLKTREVCIKIWYVLRVILYIIAILGIILLALTPLAFFVGNFLICCWRSGCMGPDWAVHMVKSWDFTNWPAIYQGEHWLAYAFMWFHCAATSILALILLVCNIGCYVALLGLVIAFVLTWNHPILFVIVQFGLFWGFIGLLGELIGVVGGNDGHIDIFNAAGDLIGSFVKRG